MPSAFFVACKLDTLFGLSNVATPRVTLRQRMEYAILRLLVGLLRMLPRNAARSVGAWLGMLVGKVAGKLSSAGEQNLQIAFPELNADERNAILQKTFRNLGWLLAEFCQMSKYTPECVQRDVMRYEGLKHYRTAKARGKGVLVLTGHLGAWELSSFVHSLLGEPMGMV
ncbi:MAG: lipid A biosynthesis acyltransferase, partial [Terriglobus sp.]